MKARFLGVALAMAALLPAVAAAQASCDKNETWFNRINISPEYSIEAYWGAYVGKVSRADDGYSWAACEDEWSKVWLVLNCAPPTKGYGGEDLSGTIPHALLLVEALPNDPEPLHVTNPADWPELIVRGMTGTTDHFREKAKVDINGATFDNEVHKAGSDWSFVTTDYEMRLRGESYDALRGNVGDTVKLEIAAGEFSLSASFFVSREVFDLAAEMDRGCPLTEQQRTMSPGQWQRRKG